MASYLLRELNPVKAFAKILNSPFSLSGEIPSFNIQLRAGIILFDYYYIFNKSINNVMNNIYEDCGKIEFPSTPENYKSQLTVLFLLFFYSFLSSYLIYFINFVIRK